MSTTPPPLPPKPPQLNQPINDGRYLQVPYGMPPPSPSSSSNVTPLASTVGTYPIACICTQCREPVMTRVEKKSGAATWVSAILVCVCGCFCGCCLIPFCMDDIKDTIHYCPNCNHIIAANKIV